MLGTLIRLLMESRYQNWNRSEAKLQARLEAQEVLERWGPLVNEETAEEFVQLYLEAA